MEKNHTQRTTLKKILVYIKKYRLLVALSMLLAAMTVTLTLYIPILTGNAVDLIIGKGAVDFEGILQILVRIAVCMLLNAVAQWVMNTCNNYITYHVVRDIREDVFAHIQSLPLSYLDTRSYGSVVSRVIADVDTFADGLLMGFTQLFTGVVTILGTLLFMLMTNIPITLVVVCITPVSFLVAKLTIFNSTAATTKFFQWNICFILRNVFCINVFKHSSTKFPRDPHAQQSSISDGHSEIVV